MNTMLPKEQFIKANNGFIHGHEFIYEYIIDDNEELYLKIVKAIKRNDKDVLNVIRLYIYNDIISKNRKYLSYAQEHILNNWLETFIDIKELYNDIYNYLNNE